VAFISTAATATACTAFEAATCTFSTAADAAANTEEDREEYEGADYYAYYDWPSGFEISM
jgi:hypothetical protein